MRQHQTLKAILCLFLCGVVGAPQGLLLQPDFSHSPQQQHYLAPHTLADSEKVAQSTVIHFVQGALQQGHSSAEVVKAIATRQVGPEQASLSAVVSWVAYAEKAGVRVEASQAGAHWVRLEFVSQAKRQTFLVSAQEQREYWPPKRHALVKVAATLLRAGWDLARVLGRPVLRRIVKVLPNKPSIANPRSGISRRELLKIAGVSAVLTLLGCAPKSKEKAMPGVSGQPVIVDMERNYVGALPLALPDAATPDTTILLRVRVDNVDLGNQPRLYHVTAKTTAGHRVVLSPFEPNPDQRFAQGFKIETTNGFAGGSSDEQTLAVRAFKVEENGQLRDVQKGETLTFTLRVLEGVNPIHPRFSVSAPDVFREAVSQPVTVQESATLITRNGQAEPGELLGSVEQNPDQISNGNDGTLRFTFRTNITAIDPLKPNYVFVAVYHSQTNEFFNGHFVGLANPTGENKIEIPAVDQQGNAIAHGTPLKLVAQNADIGLTPPEPNLNRVLTHTLQRDSSPVALPSPQIVSDPQTNQKVTLMQGTRLVKVKVNAQTSHLIQPTSHLIRLVAFDVTTQRRFTYETLRKIPLVFVGGKEVPAANQIHEYLVEIPETWFSPQFQQSSIEGIEVLNMRSGYASVSSGMQSLARQSNNEITSQAKVTSLPGISQVQAQDTLIQFTIDPKAASNDSVVAHFVTLNLRQLNTGETKKVSYYLPLPQRLSVNPQTLESSRVPETNRPHTFVVTINDREHADVIAFLQRGAAEITQVEATNISEQIPSGPLAIQNVNVRVSLPVSLGIREVPNVSSISNPVQSVGDTGVSVTLRAGTNLGGNVPVKLHFVFTLLNSLGERFSIHEYRALSALHQNNLAAEDTYHFTLEHSKIDPNNTVVLESIAVADQDAQLNEGNFLNLTANYILDPRRVSQKPRILSVAPKTGQPSVAVITFAIPTQEKAGQPLPSKECNVIIEAVTASGKQFPPTNTGKGPVFIPNVKADANGNGIVEFDFSAFGTPTVSESVHFLLRTQPIDPQLSGQRAFSAPSLAASGTFLVVASAKEPTGNRRWNRAAFSGEEVAMAAAALRTRFNSSDGSGPDKKSGAFISPDDYEQVFKKFNALIKQELDHMGGVSAFSYPTLTQLLHLAIQQSPLWEQWKHANPEAYKDFLAGLLSWMIPRLKIPSMTHFISPTPSPYTLETAL